MLTYHHSERKRVERLSVSIVDGLGLGPGFHQANQGRQPGIDGCQLLQYKPLEDTSAVAHSDVTVDACSPDHLAKYYTEETLVLVSCQLTLLSSSRMSNCQQVWRLCKTYLSWSLQT